MMILPFLCSGDPASVDWRRTTSGEVMLRYRRITQKQIRRVYVLVPPSVFPLQGSTRYESITCTQQKDKPFGRGLSLAADGTYVDAEATVCDAGRA